MRRVRATQSRTGNFKFGFGSFAAFAGARPRSGDPRLQATPFASHDPGRGLAAETCARFVTCGLADGV